MLDLLKLLFTGSAPISGEWQPLHRSPAQERHRQQWLAQQVYLNWAGPYFKAYHYQKAGLPGARFRVQLARKEGQRGAVFLYDPSMGPGNFQHFFDFIRDRVLALSYQLGAADQRTLRHERYAETTQKYFLKPQPNDCTDTGRCNQRFGNVTIDLVSINGQPGFIRLANDPFADTIFTPAATFDTLVDAVFNLPPAPAEVEQLISKYRKGS
ncbi:hypothetical protein [Hymenobacter psychrophilus]|uniref:Uncharacterized protein n=1 Tax=Hymenobacter psychrophilus TaxID=651662 RepID=A0A1H3CRF6_9BACT|nr:hypothetical protein [Hymenobacter psychrophilus]SDX56812.1 hypothetical protein SAMN04488069_10289 [Hymenobacter psychrophilus]